MRQEPGIHVLLRAPRRRIPAPARERLVTDVEELPADFRQRVEETARRLADHLQPRAGE